MRLKRPMIFHLFSYFHFDIDVDFPLWFLRAISDIDAISSTLLSFIIEYSLIFRLTLRFIFIISLLMPHGIFFWRHIMQLSDKRSQVRGCIWGQQRTSQYHCTGRDVSAAILQRPFLFLLCTRDMWVRLSHYFSQLTQLSHWGQPPADRVAGQHDAAFD